MLSYAFSTASTYFHLPVDEEEDKDIQSYQKKYLTWTSEPTTSTGDNPSTQRQQGEQRGELQEDLEESNETVNAVLANDDLYQILGVPRSAHLDKMALRRAYLSRSRACHPDKFPTPSPRVTLAFQKVSIAYSILSTPSSKRLYDSRSPSAKYDVFAVRPTGFEEETFRGVVLGVFNDFLDGDLEVIRGFLKAVSDINPSLSLGDEGMNNVLIALQGIRDRALSCRTCLLTLQEQFSLLLETQHALRQLPYLDLFGRSRLTIRLTRITLGIPLEVEGALVRQRRIYGRSGGREDEGKDVGVIPTQVAGLIRAIDVALERLERMFKQ